MDRGKRPGKLGALNSTMYMDLKDVIREHALYFLPAKSLFKFQSICRDWKYQILTPFFAHKQSLLCNSILGVFCQTRNALPTLISFDAASCGVRDPCLGFLPGAVDVKSSSNGLLLCQAHSGDRAYYVCNPTTQQFKKLPKPNVDHGPDPAAVLVFQPSLLNFETDFKVVCAFQSADFDDAIEFETYSSREGSWKVSGEISFAARNPVPRSGIHVDGSVYWTCKQGGILAFDVTKDRSLILQKYTSNPGILGDLDGKLCLARINGNSIRLNELVNVHAETMQMKSNYMMWSDTCINLDSRVVGNVGIGAVLLVARDKLVGLAGEALYLYDLKTKETKALGNLAGAYDTMRCVPYVNSLVCI